MGSGFIRFSASQSAFGAAGFVRAVPGILFVLAVVAAPGESSATGSSIAAFGGSRPASVADCTEPHGIDGMTRSLVPLWMLALPGTLASDASSLRIELDPETGTWGSAPPAQGFLAMPAEAASLSRFSDDLFEEPLPNGGVMLNLRGRFQTHSLAGRTAGGGVRFGCTEHAPGLVDGLHSEAPVLDAAGRPVK